MYRKLFFIMLGVLFMAHPAIKAQEISGYPIGFCNGEMGIRSEIKFSGKGAEVSAALHIPASYASTVGGNRLESVRVALASKMNLKSLEVWVRTSLDGENLASTTLEKGEFAQGWNNITLDSPYDIPENPGDGFFIGYTYEQTNKSGAISTLPIPHYGALWTKCNDEEWSDKSDEGTLCLEGMVFGDNLPKYNLSIISVTTDPYFIISEGTLNCVAKVRNLATVTATEFDIEASVEGVEKPCVARVECDVPIGEIGSYKFSISPDILSDFPKERMVMFKINSINGNEDEDFSDNTAEASLSVLERAFKRIVLAEEFTTEKCPNCPRVAEYFHNILANPEFSDNLEVVCHHAGYYTDPLTTSFDDDYCWFYNNGRSTYAPAIMLDRDTYQDTDTPVFSPYSQEDLENDIKAQLLMPSLVSVIPAASYGDGNAINVVVEGERVRSDILDGDRITVFLVEDNIKTTNQAGAGGTYIHNHVNRAVNSVWGVPVEYSGNSYSYTCTFDLKDGWNKDNLKIVAFISHFNPENPNDCAVANTSACPIAYSGVSEISDYTAKTILHIYDASGAEKNQLSKGLNIVVYDDFTTKKIICK